MLLIDTEFDERLIEEQRMIEMRLEQERIDLDLAQKLQDQINKESRLLFIYQTLVTLVIDVRFNMGF